MSAIYRAAGYSQILKWVDDFFVIHLPDQFWTEHKFMDLTGYFGMPWSMKKMKLLAIVQQYIGFDWDLDSCTVALLVKKLSKIFHLIEQWLKPGQTRQTAVDITC